MRREKHWSVFLHDWSDLARCLSVLEYSLSKLKIWEKPKITTQYIKKKRLNHLLYTFPKRKGLKNKPTNKKRDTGLLEVRAWGQGPPDLSAALPFHTDRGSGRKCRMQLCKL